MKRNTLQNVITFVLKYIWAICALLIVLEIGGTCYTGKILMEETANGVMHSVNGQVSNRVDGVLRLMRGMASNKIISDTSIPLFERAVLMESYKESYDLYMIAILDENINVISSDEKEPPKETTSLAYRKYMQELYKTGNYQITDIIKAGADHATLNYTIAVPIMQNEKVVGSVFGAIYFDDIKGILKSASDDNHNFMLIGSEQQIMSSANEEDVSKNFEVTMENNHVFGKTSKEIQAIFKEGKSAGFWEWGEQGLRYVMYKRVEPTQWTMVYQVSFLSILKSLFPVMVMKSVLYITICGLIFVFGRRYLRRHLASINHLVDQVSFMQKELFQNENEDLESFLELSQKGLIDQLTGLSTRAVFIRKMKDILEDEAVYGAILFIDLDDLKKINDQYGHDAGDKALMKFANILKKYEKDRNGIASRYGGDEFVFAISSIQKNEILQLVKAMTKSFDTKLYMESCEIEIHGSIGVAYFPEHGRTLEELICKADLALYEAKQDGKNGYYCFEEKKK